MNVHFWLPTWFVHTILKKSFFLSLSLFLGSWERSIITHDAVIKGATDDEISNYDWTIPTNYRRPDEVWPTSTSDDNALMIPRVPYNLLRRSPGNLGRREIESGKEEERKRDLLRSSLNHKTLQSRYPKATVTENDEYGTSFSSRISIKLFDESSSSCCRIFCGKILESEIREFAVREYCTLPIFDIWSRHAHFRAIIINFIHAQFSCYVTPHQFSNDSRLNAENTPGSPLNVSRSIDGRRDRAWNVRIVLSDKSQSMLRWITVFRVCNPEILARFDWLSWWEIRREGKCKICPWPGQWFFTGARML